MVLLVLALLEDLLLHLVVVVQEVHSVAGVLLVLVAGALNFDVDEVMLVQKAVDGIIAVVEVPAPF